MSNRPLVSLCITCYNQAKYIREAVQSAFDQTYDPLEIVICDDCSTDGTDRIVAEMIAVYRKNGGRHSLVFRRNERTLNVLKNYEQAFRMAQGELVVTGAGDDVSIPSRVERIVSAWLSDGGRSVIIHHGYGRIDEKGRNLGFDGPRKPIEPLGACSAYRRDVFDVFPSPSRENAYEDMVFGERAYMIGDALLIDDALVKYRIGGTTSNLYFDRRKLRRALQRERDSYRQLDDDYGFAVGKLPTGRIEMVKAANRKRESEMEKNAPFVFADSAADRYRALQARDGRVSWWGYAFFTKTIYVLPDWLSLPIARGYAAYNSLCHGLSERGFHPKRFARRLLKNVKLR